MAYCFQIRLYEKHVAAIFWKSNGHLAYFDTKFHNSAKSPNQKKLSNVPSNSYLYWIFKIRLATFKRVWPYFNLKNMHKEQWGKIYVATGVINTRPQLTPVCNTLGHRPKVATAILTKWSLSIKLMPNHISGCMSPPGVTINTSGGLSEWRFRGL